IRLLAISPLSVPQTPCGDYFPHPRNSRSVPRSQAVPAASNNRGIINTSSAAAERKRVLVSKTSKIAVLSLSVVLVLFTVAGGLGVRASTDDGAYRQLGVYSEVLSRIRSEYVEEPNIPQVTDGALHGLLEA